MNATDPPAAGRQWTLDLDGDRVAWLTFDRPDTNANSLSRAAMEELNVRLGEIELARTAAVVRQLVEPLGELLQLEGGDAGRRELPLQAGGRGHGGLPSSTRFCEGPVHRSGSGDPSGLVCASWD